MTSSDADWKGPTSVGPRRRLEFDVLCTQVDKLQAALALTGRAMSDLAQVDNALLLVRGEIDESIAFDRIARPRRADRSHDWYGATVRVDK